MISRNSCMTGVLLAVLGCASEPSGTGLRDESNTAGSGNSSSGGGTTPITITGGTGGAPAGASTGAGGLVVTSNGGSGTHAPVIYETLPAGFAAATQGGYTRVGPVANLQELGSDPCANILRGVVRDFEPTHPDFGAPKQPANATGMVGPIGALLGDDRKPVRVPEIYPEVAVAFDDWYNAVDNVNVSYIVDIWLEPTNGTFVFDSDRFFPVEGVGNISGNDDDGTPRNFGFTTELHTVFTYAGGEKFSFRGDDDVFVYIDSKLVLDLGGVHNPTSGDVNLDTLGLTKGTIYNLDLFHAEQNPTGSNFRIETTLDFSGCSELVIEPPK